ncbi:MAG: L,D-transpeptidase [Ktedonobacterales bacterium]|nr:L,D-transpeptidase [Ktedonobacterales bacterium]
MRRQEHSWHRGRYTAPQRRSALSLVGLFMVVAAMLLSACGSDANQALAQQNKAKLDQELGHARSGLGVPNSMLQPIEKQEAKIANGEGGWTYNYQDAASNYSLLYTQLLGVEQTATDTLKKQTGLDLQAFSTALNERRQQGFGESSAYQARLQQAQQDFTTAKLAGDYVRVDTLAKAQTEALNAMWPAYLKLNDFQSVLRALGSTGINTTLAQSEYTADLKTFRDSASADRYQILEQIIDGQILQLVADQSEGLPYVGSALLASFQARITLLASYGVSTKDLQKDHDQDAQALAAARSLADYQKLAQTINTQVANIALPLIRGKAYHDLATLRQLIKYGQSLTVINPFDGTKWPAAYEYADSPTNGLADVTDVLNQAQTQSDYQASDDDIQELITNLRAMIDNMRDTTPHSRAHATDMQLMKTYGITQGKTLVVSLREQTARFYENGKLVFWSYVTTGRPELPTPPGLQSAMYKVSPTIFTSPEPKTSPFWYPPTPINYAILFANYGFFVHDGWWRSQFGPGTNLPHFDPAAFNGGSHGCINLPLQNMAWVYTWMPLYAPILVY